MVCFEVNVPHSMSTAFIEAIHLNEHSGIHILIHEITAKYFENVPQKSPKYIEISTKYFENS